MFTVAGPFMSTTVASSRKALRYPGVFMVSGTVGRGGGISFRTYAVY